MSYLKSKRRKIESLLNSDQREIIVDGHEKIMLSCPHCVTHYRNGEIKYDEPDTLIIADYLHKKFDLPYIYKVKSDNEDVNYDAESTYKSILKEYVIKNNIKLLIDLHQLHLNRDEVINIGINGFKNLSNINFLNCLVRAFSANSIGTISIDVPFAASGENIISSYIHRNANIDCIQLEFNTKLFHSDILYNKTMKCLRDSITDIKIYFGNNNE